MLLLDRNHCRIVAISGQSLPILNVCSLGPNFWTRLPRSRTNPALAPMSRAELEHVLARGLEGKKSRLKNNKLRLSAALHRAIHNSISQNGLAGYLRQCTHRLPQNGAVMGDLSKPDFAGSSWKSLLYCPRFTRKYFGVRCEGDLQALVLPQPLSISPTVFKIDAVFALCPGKSML